MNLHSIETNEILTELAACGLRHNFFTYIRINPVLDRIDCITDGASAEHLEHLETVARQSISHNGHGKGNFDRVVNIKRTDQIFKIIMCFSRSCYLDCSL